MIYKDQIGHEFQLETVPERIISLVPSQTELLYDLGLEKQVVGITKFCIHPNKWFRTKNRVGGTKALNFDKITALNPDFIIANKEENTEHEIKELQKKYPVYTSDISNLLESVNMINELGMITGKEQASRGIVEKIKKSFTNLKSLSSSKKRVLYLIWNDPYMSISHNTFINDMMKLCGFENVIDDEQDYPTITEDDINKLDPDFIFLSSEPFPFKDNHLKEYQNKFQKAKVVLVNGEYFSWYGSRLQKAPDYFNRLINEIS